MLTCYCFDCLWRWWTALFLLPSQIAPTLSALVVSKYTKHKLSLTISACPKWHTAHCVISEFALWCLSTFIAIGSTDRRIAWASELPDEDVFFIPSGCMPAGSGFFCCDPLRCPSATLVWLFSLRDSHLSLTLPETEPRPQCSTDFVSLHPSARACTWTSGGVCVNTIFPCEMTALLCLQSLMRQSLSQGSLFVISVDPVWYIQCHIFSLHSKFFWPCCMKLDFPVFNYWLSKMYNS